MLYYFISNGIDTKKNRWKGGTENNFTIFATDISLCSFDLANDEEKRDERDSNCERAFEWFEEAYLLKKTRATIKNF